MNPRRLRRHAELLALVAFVYAALPLLAALPWTPALPAQARALLAGAYCGGAAAGAVTPGGGAATDDDSSSRRPGAHCPFCRIPADVQHVLRGPVQGIAVPFAQALRIHPARRAVAHVSRPTRLHAARAPPARLVS